MCFQTRSDKGPLVIQDQVFSWGSSRHAVSDTQKPQRFCRAVFLTSVVLWLLPICDSHLFLHTPCPLCLGALWLPGEILHILLGELMALACLSTPLPGSPQSASIALCLSLFQQRLPPPLSPHLSILLLCSPPEQGLLLSLPACGPRMAV